MTHILLVFALIILGVVLANAIQSDINDKKILEKLTQIEEKLEAR